MHLKTTPLLNRWKLFLLSGLVFLLAGCLPIPVIDIDSTSVEAGESFTVNGSGTVVSNVPENTVIASYAWEFGDGSKARGESVSHSYDKVGTYTIKLTVIDSAGRVASAEETITVVAATVTADEESTDAGSDTVEDTATDADTNTDSVTDTKTDTKDSTT